MNTQTTKSYTKRRTNQHTGYLLLLLGSCFITIFFICSFIWNDMNKNQEAPINSTKLSSAYNKNSRHEWNLILVNHENRIPKSFNIDLTTLSNGEKIDSRIYKPLQRMFDDARKAGLEPIVGSGYRTAQEQQRILDDKIAAYELEGNNEETARELALKWVARPGYSEHQLGISVDINSDVRISSEEAVYRWLADNAHKYGFIHRYPENKTHITGVINEPWHYRYVGEKAATDIYKRGICLEEYLNTMK